MNIGEVAGISVAGDNLGIKPHPEWRLFLWVVLLGVSCAFSVVGWKGTEFAQIKIAASIFILLITISYYWIFNRNIGITVLVVSALAIGVVVSQSRIESKRSDFTPSRTIVSIEGQISRLEYRPEGQSVRIFLKPTKVGHRNTDLPELIRIFARTEVEANVRTGSHVRFAAKVSRPNGPIVPGGYDFERAAFFKGVGLDAIAVSSISLLAGTGTEPLPWASAAREYIENQLMTHIGGQEGALAVALTVGYRNHLSKETKENLRRAGLSHLLAISGLHMGLVTAAGFFIFELLFAALPFIALRVMPKKAAVIPSFMIAVAYLFLSGAGTSTIRAFIMVSVGLLAVLTDRRVLSLRSVAIAAGLIMLVWPEMVLSVGFQMSFAATAGLVAFYEAASRWMRANGYIGPKSRLVRVLAFVAGTGLTSFVAQLAIAPFALYHFQTLSIIGVFANMLVLPVVSLLVMPLLLVAVLFSPVGGVTVLSPALYPSFTYIRKVAGWFADSQHAVFETGAMADGAFVIAVMSFLALLVLTRSLKTTLVFALLLVGSVVLGQKDTVDLLISSSGNIVAEAKSIDQSTNTGRHLHVSGGRTGSFRERGWLRYWNIPQDSTKEKMKKICDATACSFWPIAGPVITRIKALAAVKQACAGGHIVILAKRYERYCKGAALVLTREMLEQRGPAGVRVRRAVLEIEWSR